MIIIHTTSNFTNINTFSALPVVVCGIDIFAQFAVPMFVLISGLVLSFRYDGDYSIRTFYKKRINRLLIPYLIWSLIYIGMNFYSNKDISISEIIFNLLTGTAFYHLWFFFLIFQLYILFPFYRKFLKGKSFFIVILIYIIQIAFNYFKIGLVENAQLAIVVKRIFLSHIFYFSLGIWIADNLEKVEVLLSKFKFYITIFILIITGLGVYLFTFNWLAINNKFYSEFNMLQASEKITLPLLYVFVFILLYYVASKTSLRTKNFLETISKYSFGIYLSHALILFIIIRLLGKINIYPKDTSFYFIAFIGTFVLSYTFCFIAEKTILSRYLLSINQKK